MPFEKIFSDSDYGDAFERQKRRVQVEDGIDFPDRWDIVYLFFISQGIHYGLLPRLEKLRVDICF